ncbi:MAG: HD domain-containing phosphohydrolase [Dehalococcoidia bacterium]|nr:HD domain-containing phosphohydrolase [Dehalococcoidia bacterium]
MCALVSDYLKSVPAIIPILISIMRHDASDSAKAANVVIYSLGLSRYMGVADRRQLHNLAIGAFFHDLGRAHLPQRILAKTGILSPEEWAIMRRHPSWGAEILASAAVAQEVVLAMVAQHHERLDGSGYPNCLEGDELDRFARIVAVADVYDALTADRPYRKGKLPFDSLMILRQEAASRLGRDMFAGMVHFLADMHGAYADFQRGES